MQQPSDIQAVPPRKAPREELEQRIRALAPWFHNMDVGGVMTAPDHFLGDYPQTFWRCIEPAVPKDLTGKTVLDIGCNAGFFALELAKRGAARVLAVDHDERYLAQARLAVDVAGFRDRIELGKLSVYDVGSLGEKFDVVVFMGVLYHLRHPLLALDLIREHVAKDLMLFETMVRGSRNARAKWEKDYPFEEESVFDHPEWPKMHFIEKDYAKDWTNWWAPNVACAEAMLRSAGFSILAHPIPEVWLCKVAEPGSPWGAVYPARSPDGAAGAEWDGADEEG